MPKHRPKNNLWCRRLACLGSRDGRTNYLRFSISPNSGVALAARVKCEGKEYIGTQRELYLAEQWLEKGSPYERGSWGPKEADAFIAPDGFWRNPRPLEVSR